MTYKIKNWSRFQHFKDRRPPWVKLYRDLLDDLDWFELDPLASKTLINLWLIASEYDGCLPSLEILSFRLRLKKQEITKILNSLSHWMEQDDIKEISEGYQLDRPETETETETETEKEKKTEAPEGVSVEVWNDFVLQRKKARAVISENVIKSIAKEAQKAGWSLEQALSECSARGWRGFKAEWVKQEKPKETKMSNFWAQIEGNK